MARTGLVFVKEGLRHDTGWDHPERADRLRAISRAFEVIGWKPPRIDYAPASRDDLLRVHTAEHIDMVETVSRERGHYPCPDTVIMEASYDAALAMAGGALAACGAVMDGVVDNAFVAGRPPGHHAERDRAMGFCLFNNIAIAARWLRSKRGVKKVAILDWDVHHGNGTQQAFYEDDSVYYASIHQWPHYPGTGKPEERGAGNTNLNCCVFPGAAAAEWLDALDQKILPEFDRFSPDFLLISAGFDAHQADPLSHQNLTAKLFAQMTERVRALARGRVVSILEGGYDLDALAKSVVAHVQALEGLDS